MSMVYPYVGTRIRVLRKERHMTQADLALHLGLTRTSITNLEAGTQRLNLDELYKLCALFEVELGEILPPISRVLDIPQHRIDFRKKRGDVRNMVSRLIDGEVL